MAVVIRYDTPKYTEYFMSEDNSKPYNFRWTKALKSARKFTDVDQAIAFAQVFGELDLFLKYVDPASKEVIANGISVGILATETSEGRSDQPVAAER